MATTSPSRRPAAELVKDAAYSALIALALAAPIIGLQTVTARGGLGLNARWDDVFLIVLAVFAGRLLLNFTIWRHQGARPIGQKWFQRAGGRPFARHGHTLSKIIGPLALAVALLLPALPFSDRYVMDLSIMVLTYIMLGWGLNIVVGLAGLLDLGYVAFYAIGAYSFALLATHFDLGFWICLPLAGILAAFWGVILGFPVLRLRGDYLAIVTLAFGEIIRVVLLNWYEFTGGPNGILGIPDPTLFGLEFARRGDNTFHEFFGLSYSSMHKIIFLYYIILCLALITNFVTLRLRRLPVGRAWEALREDEIACRSLGINTTNTKLTAFAIGAMFGGFAGSFFATRQGFISPESFTFIESALILAIVVLGGLGSQVGVVIAAIVMMGGFEYFREFEQYRMLIFGLAMVFIMVWRPRGLISTRSPSVILKERKAIGADLVGQGHG
ncbi:high-affinity branched-chain amino acid ABC transporter permease LivM [Lutibaculum baratangense]|uniref:Branched-chain amino acid transport system permease protein LivM n=1 Tax=Lutibaculum baratangense AMV1 TaxID=631454 RepID=V4T770_9HYPH|nr:high-affinity branched-chain amino acid ABC transporter permease LivM [Lutibaculum baratangense]ESR22463.1 Branched-chain amino acid transport system permease protein LivM [Lutibaculum baratangense AMV1]